MILLPKDYLKVHHEMRIVESDEYVKVKLAFDNLLMKDRWKIIEGGGLVVYNKAIIAIQDSVITFMMSTFKKKIFSKGPLNISLPVTIFNHYSQLSMYAFGFGNAPEYLEPAAKSTDPVVRMKKVMIFALTHSVTWVDIEKPFNPILGETYQSSIAGCPFYAEQISHHPPVTSFLFLGRGYKIYGSVEATVNININSADGLNFGWYHVIFDDGQ